MPCNKHVSVCQDIQASGTRIVKCFTLLKWTKNWSTRMCPQWCARSANMLWCACDVWGCAIWSHIYGRACFVPNEWRTRNGGYTSVPAYLLGHWLHMSMNERMMEQLSSPFQCLCVVKLIHYTTHSLSSLMMNRIDIQHLSRDVQMLVTLSPSTLHSSKELC